MPQSVFLDVDSSIVENNLKIAKNEEEEQLSKLFTEANYPSKLVKPTPGMCIKSKEIGTGKKVFVNICQTDAIPPPKDVTGEELKEIIQSEDAGNYRVPMSIGEIRSEKDKKGEEAKVCDVAINPKFFKKIEDLQEFRNVHIAMIFQSLENKHGLICEDDSIILKNRKFFGTLQTHRIQQRDIDEKMKGGKTLLEEIGGEKEQKKAMIEVLETKIATKEPEYRLFRKKNSKNCLYAEFKLPDVISIKEITLDVGEDRIVLESKTRGYLLDIFVPYIIKQKACTCTFNKITKVLSLTAPLVGG